MSVANESTLQSTPRRLRVGSVSFLNAKPLIYGLENDGSIDLSLAVPSKLLDGLLSQQLDVALLPVIDYQRMDGLRLVPAGGIGCDGNTLTVRLFSATPIERIRTLACDTDSHTSVVLARVILAESFGLKPELVELDRQRHVRQTDTAVLLIGDKVVCEEPRDLPYQLDLGEAWKQLTGLPFVFAAWMARGGVELADLPAKLELAKKQGLSHIDIIIRQHAVNRGWAVSVARRYLTEHLQFDIGPRQLQAIESFHEHAYRIGALPNPPRKLRVY